MAQKPQPPKYPVYTPERLAQLATDIRENIRQRILTQMAELKKLFGQLCELPPGKGDLAMEHIRDRLDLLLEQMPLDRMRSLESKIYDFNQFYQILVAPHANSNNLFPNPGGHLRSQLSPEEIKIIQPLVVSDEFISILESITPIRTDFCLEPDSAEGGGIFSEVFWIANRNLNRVVALNIVKDGELAPHIEPIVAWSRVVPYKPLEIIDEAANS